MKKKLCLMAVAVLVVITAFAAVNMTWVKVSDPDCNRCVMNDLDRICGKCKGFMEEVPKTCKYENGYLKSTYKCKKCNHTIIYKVKNDRLY